MAKIDFLPVVCGMAVGTLPREMVHRLFIAVAADAIGETGVIKGSLRPICRVVASGALAWVMIDRRIHGVTPYAISETSMVKGYAAPGF